jgi:hypothetical protein
MAKYPLDETAIGLRKLLQQSLEARKSSGRLLVGGILLETRHKAGSEHRVGQLAQEEFKQASHYRRLGTVQRNTLPRIIHRLQFHYLGLDSRGSKVEFQ